MTVLGSDFESLVEQIETILVEVYIEAFAETINLNGTSYYDDVIGVFSSRLSSAINLISGDIITVFSHF